MKKSDVRKSLSSTTRSSGILRRGVFLGYCGLKFERHLKVVLLSGTMGVLGSLAAYAGSSSVPLGTNIGNMAPAGSVAAQTVDECLEREVKPWDIACLLLRPVGTIPDGPLFTPGDRGDDDDDDDTTTTTTDDDDDDDDDDTTTTTSADADNDNGVGNGHTGTVTGQDGIAEGDPSNPGEGGGFGRNGGGNAGRGDDPPGRD